MPAVEAGEGSGAADDAPSEPLLPDVPDFTGERRYGKPGEDGDVRESH